MAENTTLTVIDRNDDPINIVLKDYSPEEFSIVKTLMSKESGIGEIQETYSKKLFNICESYLNFALENLDRMQIILFVGSTNDANVRSAKEIISNLYLLNNCNIMLDSIAECDKYMETYVHLTKHFDEPHAFVFVDNVDQDENEDEIHKLYRKFRNSNIILKVFSCNAGVL